MELKRKAFDELVTWKERVQGRSALLIEGARRVGKSTLARKFGEKHYRTHIVIDFAQASRAVRRNFEENLTDLGRFFQNLSLEYSTRLYPRESLIIFNEVQLFPKAREAIKYLVADGRFDFLETGSLISIKESVEHILIPSEEEKLHMHPLDFEEFLWASGEAVLADHIRASWLERRALDTSAHRRASRAFREYMLVGGMPQSVVAYFEGHRSFHDADRAKRQILSLYRDDIMKASRTYRLRVSAVFDNVPGFLSTHEKRVVLAKTGTGTTFSEFDEPLFWLANSMICNLCHKTTDPNIGLALNRDDSAVKCYMGDTGLLVSMAFSPREIAKDNLYKQVLDGKLSLNEGMLHENAVAQALTAQGHELYFYTHYSPEKHRNDIEVDFLLADGSPVGQRILPIEVKSSKNYTKVSHDKFKKRFGNRIGEAFIIHPKQFQASAGETRIPSYMAFCAFDKG